MYMPNEIHYSWTFSEDWPQTIEDMVDSPMRTMVKLALEVDKVKGVSFVSFFQLYLRDLIGKERFFEGEEIVYSDDQIERLREFIYTSNVIYEALVKMIFIRTTHLPYEIA